MDRWTHIELDRGSILFADQDLIAVDKAAGVLCDASIDPKRDHLGTALGRWAKDADSNIPAGADDADGATFLPAHRLDLGTSGVVLFARNRASATALMQQFQDRTVTKQYQAVVFQPGHQMLTPGDAMHRRSYLRHRKGISEEVRSGGKPAESDFEVTEVNDNLALVRAFPKTGRTHQLRVHLAALGAPIAGDDRYGSQRRSHQSQAANSRLWLHADTLLLTHPATQQPLQLRSLWSFELTNGEPHAVRTPHEPSRNTASG